MGKKCELFVMETLALVKEGDKDGIMKDGPVHSRVVSWCSADKALLPGTLKEADQSYHHTHARVDLGLPNPPGCNHLDLRIICLEYYDIYTIFFNRHGNVTLQ